MSSRLTKLPSDAPRAYGRSELGPKTEAWMKAQGWIDHRVVTRPTENAALAYRIALLEAAPAPAVDVVA